MKLIPLTKGQHAKVDSADFAWLSQWKWCASDASPGKFYAVRGPSVAEQKTGQRNLIFMHRELLKIKGKTFGDHKDRDSLNNQRKNLRLASHSQSGANRGLQSNNTSGFRGVFWHRVAKKWMAQIRVMNHNIYLGLFESPKLAAKVYDRAALKYFRKFAVLNFCNQSGCKK